MPRYFQGLLFALIVTALNLPALPAFAQSTPRQLAPEQLAPEQLAQAELHELTVQLPGGPSLRYAGLLLAVERGYFTSAGIDLVLRGHIPEEAPVAAVADGNADLAIDILPSALRARAETADVVHVAQIFQRATLSLVCRPDVDQPGKLAGENIGVWMGGWESSFYAWLNRLGLSYFASGGGVTVLRQSLDAEMFLAGEVDCMTTTSYQAPLQLAPMGDQQAALVTYSYEDLGLGVLEDGLYARGGDLADPARIDLFARFLAALGRGWQAAAADPAAATKMLAALPENEGIDPAVLRRALGAVNAALAVQKDGLVGQLDPAAYDRSVNLLLTGAPEPVLTAAPDAAISDLVFRQRRQLGRFNN
ncbi:ABC transporter substrate-binding protein [Dongia sp.]|uniref:ABC transporter substrate-binding protein n=1 Tax=Dongia sp. TaxID=1977262 RepID=UPI0035AF02A6